MTNDDRYTELYAPHAEEPSPRRACLTILVTALAITLFASGVVALVVTAYNLTH